MSKETYNITVTVDKKWIDKWWKVAKTQPADMKYKLQTWMEIQTAGTGISVESVTKEE